MSADRRLTIAVTGLAHNAAVVDGRVTIPGIEFEPIHVPGDHAQIFHRMCRDREFDVCELSVMSYFCARQYGIGISAIPVVPRHLFHHGDFLVNVEAGIKGPKDLEGKRVGTRCYTVTPGVLDRGILEDEFDVDLGSITWVLAEHEHVGACEEHYPPNVVPGRDEDLFPRLASGDIDAGIAGSNLKRLQSPHVAPLFSDPDGLDRKQYERTGFAPVFTCIAFKSELLHEIPGFDEQLFRAFEQAREFGLQPDAKVARIVPDNPVPIGFEANRASFEELLDLGMRQHILSGEQKVEDLFPAF